MSENASVTANLGPQHLGAARDTVAQVLEEAKRQGASAAEAQLSLAQGLSVDVRLGEVAEAQFLPNKSKTGQKCAFVSFLHAEHAAAAIEARSRPQVTSYKLRVASYTRRRRLCTVALPPERRAERFG